MLEEVNVKGMKLHPIEKILSIKMAQKSPLLGKKSKET